MARTVWLSAAIAAMLAAALAAAGCRSCRGEGKITRMETRALGEALMMIKLAGEDVIRDSAQRVDAPALAADPATYARKWLVVEGEVSWLQSRDGERISLEQAQPEKQTYYWLEGPVTLLDTSDKPPLVDAGGRVRAYGRSVEVNVDGLGLAPSGEESLRAMEGGEKEKVVLLLAKWVEVL